MMYITGMNVQAPHQTNNSESSKTLGVDLIVQT